MGAEKATITVTMAAKDKEAIKQLAKVEGKNIATYVRDRCIKSWSDYELEDLGFGLILRAFRKKGYPDSFVREWVGETLRMLRDVPIYSIDYKKGLERAREIKRMMEDDLNG
jgi:hypothetical protein